MPPSSSNEICWRLRTRSSARSSMRGASERVAPWCRSGAATAISGPGEGSRPEGSRLREALPFLGERALRLGERMGVPADHAAGGPGECEPVGFRRGRDQPLEHAARGLEVVDAAEPGLERGEALQVFARARCGEERAEELRGIAQLLERDPQLVPSSDVQRLKILAQALRLARALVEQSGRERRRALFALPAAAFDECAETQHEPRIARALHGLQEA